MIKKSELKLTEPIVPTWQTIKGAAVYALKGRAGAGEELKTQIKQVIPKVKEALMPKVSPILKETIKGLPAAAATVFKAIWTSPPLLQIHPDFKVKVLLPLKRILLKGTPSTEELQKAVDKMSNLRAMNLPSEIYQKQIKKIIEGIKLR